MFSSGKSHRSSSSSHGVYVRPAHSRSTGSLPTFSSFSATRSPHSSSRAKSSWLPGFGASSSSSSYYKRRPRDGYIQSLIHKIKRILRDLYRYIKKNPFKALFPIVMALISSGALAALAGRFGFRIPQSVLGAVGAGQSVKGGYDAWYGSQHGGEFGGAGSGAGSGWGGDGTAGILKGAVKMASAFM